MRDDVWKQRTDRRLTDAEDNASVALKAARRSTDAIESLEKEVSTLRNDVARLTAILAQVKNRVVELGGPL
jgi:polyhydroxyalkanoate synthesis regulator phasin